MAKYEAMYIIRPEVEAEARKNLIEEINNIFLSRGTEKVDVNEWGMRDLAYEIEDCTKGYYVVLAFEGNGDAIKEFDRISNIKEEIIRHICVRLDK